MSEEDLRGAPRVLIAPDSFKGTASAAEAAQAIAEGWAAVRPGDALALAPMADGGEGTLDAFAAADPGARSIPVQVTGPDGRPVQAQWLLLSDGTGVVELANTSGITLLDPLRGMDAHTLGFGQAIRAALEHGVRRLVLGIGGSSSTDGGAGALLALGARLLNADGEPVPLGARGLAAVAAVDLRGIAPLPADGALVVTDVRSPLLGPTGAAAVFGPQKGLTPEEIPLADAALARFAALLPAVAADAPGAGAAGGTGFGLLAWGARLTPGSDAVAEAIGLEAAVRASTLVITGEGQFDAQSAQGKVPSHVLGLARDADSGAALVAGRIVGDSTPFDDAVALSDLAGSPAAAMAEPLRWLREAGALLARRWQPAGKPPAAEAGGGTPRPASATR